MGSAETPLPPTGLTPPALADGGESLRAGSELGPYTIVELAGAGGMGEVYRAVDGRLQRDVAIKVLRAALIEHAADRARARLFREAQSMAKLSHPNVLAVHEIGTEAGHVFIVMDFVRGETLREWLRREPRTWRQVVAMFAQAARGLCAAHRAKVVHRDFKPDNVLVDEEGRARVTDFGVAGITGSDDSSGGYAFSGGSGGTQSSVFVGTPAYMAPEQHRGSADPRSDQFAFCVALHEALHGVRPFAGQSADEILENSLAGRMVDLPKGPGVPAHVRRLLLRGLAADPDARYPSMEALLADLERDPWPRRRRLAAIAVLAGLAGVAALVGPRLARRERPCAGAASRLAGIWDGPAHEAMRRAFTRSGAPDAAAAYGVVAGVLDGYAARWVAVRTDACEATAVREEQSAALMDLRVDCLEQRAAELTGLVKVLTAPEVTADVVARAPGAARALESLDRCAGASLAGLEPPPRDPGIQASMAALHGHLDDISALQRTGQYDRALALAEPALIEARAMPYDRLRAEALHELGRMLGDLGEFDAAEAAFKDARQAAARARADELMADISIDLAYLLIDAQGRTRDAIELLSAAAAEVERAGAPPRLRVHLAMARGMFAIRSNHHAEARGIAAEALPVALTSLSPADQLVADMRVVFGLAAKGTGDYAVAEAVLRKALRDGETYGAFPQELSSRMINLGTVLRLAGRLDEAGALFEGARAIQTRTGMAGNHHLVRVLAFLAGVRNEQGRYAEAQAFAEQALEQAKKNPRATFPGVPTMTEALARSQLGQGRPTEALARLDEVMYASEGTLGPSVQALLLNARGDVLAALGRWGDARADHARALAVEEPVVGPTHPSLAVALLGIATSDLHLAHPEAAIPLLERAIVLRTVRPGRPWQLAEARYALALALRATGVAGPRPRELAEQARAALEACGHGGEAAEVAAWLAANPG